MMDAALQRSRRVITLLSHAYLGSEYCGAEWRAVFAEDPKNWRGRLVLFRVENCQPRGLLSLLAYTDLVPVLTSESLLREVILASLGDRRDSATQQLMASYCRAATTLVHFSIRSAPNFTGRAEMFTALDQAFETPDKSSSALSVIHGIAGSGKSSFAHEYCWTRRERYSGVWWIDGSNEDKLKEGLISLGSEFIRGLDQLEDKQSAAEVVISRLFPNFCERPWLLLYDAIDDEQLLSRWSPQLGAHILATTRLANWGTDTNTFRMDMLSDDESLAYLRRQGARPDIAEKDLRELGNKVGYLPLALSHLAAFMKSARAVSGSRLVERMDSLLMRRPTSNLQERSVAATFDLAIETAETKVAGCRAILAFASFFSPHAVPEELFAQSADLYPDEVRQFVSNAELREDALGVLDQLSLIRFNSTNRSFDIHVLVQIAAAPKDQPKLWWQAAQNILYRIYPHDKYRDRAMQERFSTHAWHLDWQSAKYTGDLRLFQFAWKAAEIYQNLTEQEWEEEVATFERKIAAAIETYGAVSEEVRGALNQFALECGWRGDQHRHAEAWRRATQIVLDLEGGSERAMKHANCFYDALRKCGLHLWQIAQQAESLGFQMVAFDVDELTRGMQVNARAFGLSLKQIVEVLSKVANTSPPDPSQFLFQSELELLRAGATDDAARELVAKLAKRLGVQYRGSLSIPAGTRVLESDEKLMAVINDAMNKGGKNYEDLFSAIEHALREVGAQGAPLESLLDDIASQFRIDRTVLGRSDP